jgi:hypothetical protein
VCIEVESCLQVVTAVAVHSHAALQAAHDSGLLPALIAELDNSDILLQMNALELLTKLAVFESGLQYLRQHGIVTALANRVTAVSEDPLASLSLPGDHGSVHHSTIHKEKSNKMQQCIKILLFPIYMKLSVFQVKHCPLSGA